MPLSLGYAQGSLTPALDRPVYLAGFGQNRRAESIHDPLSVRALSLAWDGGRLVLAALDLIGLARRHCLALEARVRQSFPGTRLILTCTHTHHAPDSIGLWGPDEATPGIDLAWFDGVIEAVAAAVESACAASTPAASIKSFAHPAPGFARNARDPHILDDELSGLQFVDGHGRPLASLVVFPCHPETLWEFNPHVTADYVHALRRDVESASGAPCLFMAGDLGGMMTPDVRDHSFAESEAIGAGLAKVALEAFAAAESAPLDPPALATQAFEIPMQSPLFELAINGGLLPDDRSPSGALLTEANLIRFGPAWLLTVPGELLPALGLAYKARLKAAGANVAVVVGLANDELGYILPPDQYKYPDDPFNPGAHYEETMSVGPLAGPRLTEAVERLVEAAAPVP